MTYISLSLEKLLWQGRGLSRLDTGQVVILEPGGLPGEKVLAEIHTTRRDFCSARVVEILEAAPERRPHPCAYAPDCGGSSFGIVDGKTGLHFKQDMLWDVLTRSLGKPLAHCLPTTVPLHPSPQNWGYRWRTQVHIQQGVPHAIKQGSHSLTPIQHCALLAPELSQALEPLAKTLPDGRFTLAASPLSSPRTECDPRPLQFSLPFVDTPVEIPPGAFFQANAALNTELISTVCSAAQDSSRVADLFAGSGNFALPLAAQGHAVLAIEGYGPAAHQGRLNSQRTGVPAQWVHANLLRKNTWTTVKMFAPDCLVLDPPRSGAKGIGQNILKISSVKRLIWISCDMATTLRDLRPLFEAGWKLTALEIFDMFPGSWHMETFCILDAPPLKA